VSALLVTDKKFKGRVYSKFGCLKPPWLEHARQGTIAGSILLTRNSFLDNNKQSIAGITNKLRGLKKSVWRAA